MCVCVCVCVYVCDSVCMACMWMGFCECVSVCPCLWYVCVCNFYLTLFIQVSPIETFSLFYKGALCVYAFVYVCVSVCMVYVSIMVNGLHLYSAFLTTQSALQYCLTFTHSYAHSHTDGGVSHARQQPAHLEQVGLGALLRDTSTLS